MSSSSSSSHGRAIVPWDTGGPLSQPQFPAGLRVLVVDDDVVCLRVIDQMLKICHYKVTTCNRAVIALEILRERNWEFDIILSDLHMPDMDGFKLLEHVGLEMDLPVIMMSADEGKDVVMKGVKHGACDYLLKPVSMEALKNIWQHVVRKKRNNELKELENSGSVEDGDKQKKRFEETDYTSSNEANLKNLKKRKDEKEEEVEERDDSSATKKQRVVWSMELHSQFLDAVKKLGVEKAVPKKILEMMNIPGLTRENVASHLQKYRLYLRRVHPQQNPNRVDTHFSGTSEAYSPMSSLDQYRLQFLADSGRIPPQSVLPVPSGSSIVTNTGMNMPISGQKPFFDPDVHSSKLRSSVGQPVTSRQMSLNGLQNYIEPGQFGMEQRQFGETHGFLPSALNASSSFSHGAINGHLNNSSVMQIPQQGQHISLSHQQSRGYLVNANVREHDSGEQMLSGGILTQILGRNGTAVSGESSPEEHYTNNAYGTSQAFYAANYQNNCVNGSIGNSHAFASSTGACNIKSTSMIQAVASATESSKDVSSMKLLKPVYTNYDIVGDLHQSQDWKLQNVNLSYGSAQLLGPKQNHAILKEGTGRNTCTFRKEVFSITAEIEPQKVACVPQHNGALRVENPCRLKEVVPDSSYQNEFDNLQDDFMDGVRFQQQEGFGQDEQPCMVDILGA